MKESYQPLQEKVEKKMYATKLESGLTYVIGPDGIVRTLGETKPQDLDKRYFGR